MNPLFAETQQDPAYESLSHLQMKEDKEEGVKFESKQIDPPAFDEQIDPPAFDEGKLLVDPPTVDDADDRYTVTATNDELKGIGGLAGRKAALYGK